MKYLVLIASALLLTSLNTRAQGTASATMRVSATVVSGVTLANSQQININLQNDEITGGTFTLTTPENLDTEITIEEQLILKNEFGEVITYNPGTKLQSSDKNKFFELLASPNSQDRKSLKGTYTGELIASVQYL